ncbi:MAG: DNA polymerase III subunit beta, partial [Elusimicrobia bacterium]|nr:DNA polymerase III subunit beta [Elusimicrobiota bacterium]
MKIHCTKEDLSKGVQTIQSALSTRTTLPILLNFLMETEQAKLKVISTNLEMGVKHYIHAEVESDGSVTIPAKKFADILHSLPDGQDIELSVDSSGKVHLKCGKSRFWIIGAPKSEYPVLPEFNRTGAFQMSSQLLGEMVRKTIFAASTDETRYVLNGVLWVAFRGALEMVATDGRRLAVIRRKGIPEEKEFKVIVPVKILHEFLRLEGLPVGADET